MSDLVVIVFDNEDAAEKALRTAVVAKDFDGKVHIKNELSSGIEVGAVVGGLLGLLTTFMFPIVGAAVGTVAGGWIGSMFEDGVDPKFVDDVSRALEPGKSALFLVIRDADPAALRAALDPYPGRVYQTTLPEELKEELEEALRKPN